MKDQCFSHFRNNFPALDPAYGPPGRPPLEGFKVVSEKMYKKLLMEIKKANIPLSAVISAARTYMVAPKLYRSKLVPLALALLFLGACGQDEDPVNPENRAPNDFQVDISAEKTKAFID